MPPPMGFSARPQLSGFPRRRYSRPQDIRRTFVEAGSPPKRPPWPQRLGPSPVGKGLLRRPIGRDLSGFRLALDRLKYGDLPWPRPELCDQSAIPFRTGADLLD